MVASHPELVRVSPGCVVKSLAAGEVVKNPRQNRSPTRAIMVRTSSGSTASCSVSSQFSQRVVINTSRVSYNPSLELTTVLNDDHTIGSTASGDSFVLNIDWNDEDFHAPDESFEDPYLGPKENILQRRRDDLERDFQYGEVSNRRTDSSVKPPRHPKLRSSPLATCKSLGSFEFPSRNKSSGRPLFPKRNGSNHTHYLLETGDVDPTEGTPRTADESSWSTGSPREKIGQSSNRGNSESELRQRPRRTNGKSLGSFSFPSDLAIPQPKDFSQPDDVSARSSDSAESFRMEDPMYRKETLDEVTRWKTTLVQLKCPPNSFRRASTLLHLGVAQMDAEQFDMAVQSFLHAVTIFRASPRRVALARALDRLGIACSHQRQWVPSLQYLLEAFNIRYEELGPCHVDTVDTMNHMAIVYMLSGQIQDARRCFWEVFWVRKAIFGANHPSVAVSAHDLANAFYAGGQLSDADNFYQISMEIYDKMGLAIQNPAVRRLLRDMKRLDRVERLFEKVNDGVTTLLGER